MSFSRAAERVPHRSQPCQHLNQENLSKKMCSLKRTSNCIKLLVVDFLKYPMIISVAKHGCISKSLTISRLFQGYSKKYICFLLHVFNYPRYTCRHDCGQWPSQAFLCLHSQHEIPQSFLLAPTKPTVFLVAF